MALNANTTKFILRPASVDSLPPLEEVVEGIKASFASFFQVGFLHASSFIERITEDLSSVNVLLVVALLAMGAPFTHKLCQRYGGKSQAAECEFRAWLELSIDGGGSAAASGANAVTIMQISVSWL